MTIPAWKPLQDRSLALMDHLESMRGDDRYEFESSEALEELAWLEEQLAPMYQLEADRDEADKEREDAR